MEAKKSKSVKRNYIYNLVYQIFALLTPLITTPYVSRVLGSSGVGQYSFTYSITSYFILFGALGFGHYAQREIARHQNNKVEQTKIFFEILIARFLSVFVSLFIHFIIILTGIYGETYSLLMLIMSISILSTAFDITFLFQGNEEFGIIVIRNIFIKVIGIATIFIFVKDKSHVWLYALCQSFILIVSHLSLWTRLPKMLVKIKFSELNIKKHIIPTLRLFVPTIAVSVYTVLDKTLIGIIVQGTTTVKGEIKNISDIENGNYNQSEQIVKMVMTVITSLGTVMIPRNSYAIASGDTRAFKQNVQNALRFVFFIGIPIMLGLMSISFNFSSWFFGPGYERTPYLIIILSPLVVIIGLSNVLGLQYLLPLKDDKKYTISIICGAIVNFFLNLCMIYYFWSFGAAIATIIAEIVVTSLMLHFSKRDINLLSLIVSSWKYFLSGIIMLVILIITQLFMDYSILTTLILVLEGAIVYFVLLLLLKDDITIQIISKTRCLVHKQF